MRLASLFIAGRPTIGVRDGNRYRDLTALDRAFGSDIGALLGMQPDWRREVAQAARAAPWIPPAHISYRPVIPRPPKVLCLGLNDAQHAREAGLEVPTSPVVFARVACSLIGHQQPMLRPGESEQLDYEVELAVIVGKGGRRIPEAQALDHVAGYSVFNDGSVRDYQVRTHQWTLGKNFPGTGALGPDLVTCDELPPGAAGLRMTTQIGDEVLQEGNTSSMIFDVARTISLLSEAVLFEPGDVIAMGTPAGIGHARTPPRYLKAGETCCVAIERVGALSNPVVDDPPVPAQGATATVAQTTPGGA